MMHMSITYATRHLVLAVFVAALLALAADPTIAEPRRAWVLLPNLSVLKRKFRKYRTKFWKHSTTK